MQFWDTSTLLKLYVPESDSALFAAHLATEAIYASEMARFELLRAVVRKEIEHAIPPLASESVFNRFLGDVGAGRVVLLSLDAAVETRFRSLVLQLHRRQPPVVVRTLDAIHLATANVLLATEVVTADSHMRAGAMAMGLKVFP